MAIRILFADDQQLLRGGIRALIEGHPNMSVIAEAADGKSAVELAAKLLPDIVIIDVEMPRLNGIEATRQILENNIATKVIAMSRHLERNTLLRMFDSGASGYVLKNCNISELTLAIQKIMSNHTYLSPIVTDCIIDDYIHSSQYENTTLAVLKQKKREVLQQLIKCREAREIADLLRVGERTARDCHEQAPFKHSVLHPRVGYHECSISNKNSKINYVLTSREKEILAWVKEGKNNWEISAILGISQNTVKFHLKNIFQKLNTTNRSQAIAVAFRCKLIDV